MIERHASDAVVHEAWPPFLDAAIRARCVIVAFQEPGGEITEELLGRLSAPGMPPLIVVAQPDGATLDLLGGIRYFRFVAVQEAEERLAVAVAEAVALSPRAQLADRLLGSLDPEGRSTAVVHEVLLAEEPIASSHQLADRLGCKLRALRSEWDRDGRLVTDYTLGAFIRWGRSLRAVEALERGLAPVEVALMLDIDLTTLRRNLIRETRS